MTKIQSKSKIKNSQQKYKNNDEKDLEYIEKLRVKNNRQLSVLLNTMEKNILKIKLDRIKLDNKLNEAEKKCHFVKDILMERWRQPSQELLEAIKEVENGETTIYDSVDDMMKDLNNEI